MNCLICRGIVIREVTLDMCYPKEYVCKECGATHILRYRDGNEKLVLIEQPAIA